MSGSDCMDWLVFGNFAIVLLFLPLLFSEPDQVQALRALGHSYRLPCGKYHKWRQYYAGGSPRGRGWPGVGHTQPEAAGRHYGGMIALSVPNGLNNTEQSRSLLFSVSSVWADCWRHAVCRPKLWHCSSYSLLQVKGEIFIVQVDAIYLVWTDTKPCVFMTDCI